MFVERQKNCNTKGRWYRTWGSSIPGTDIL